MPLAAFYIIAAAAANVLVACAIHYRDISYLCHPSFFCCMVCAASSCLPRGSCNTNAAA
jgi:hypothetical protein